MAKNCEGRKLFHKLLEWDRKLAERDFLRMQETICPWVPQENVVLVKSLADVLDCPPFKQPEDSVKEDSVKGLTIFCDFDGVISFPGRSHDENLVNLMNLARIVKKASRFVLWSSRVNIDDNNPLWRLQFNIFDRRISSFPFFSDSSLRRLYHFLNQIAGNKDGERQVEIDFRIGITKLFQRDDFLKLALKALAGGGPLVVIGSSHFDRRQIERLVKRASELEIPLNNLYYFDTGYVLL